jgi:uncharacterized protein YsxB (DUF464 family)
MVYYRKLDLIRPCITVFNPFGAGGKGLVNKPDNFLINIEVFKKKDGIARVRVTGHGGGKKGEDIVCCAVSSITQTALAGLLFYGKNYINWYMEDGLLDISISDSEDLEISSAFYTILFTMILGLKGVSKEYPKKIKLELSKDFDI